MMAENHSLSALNPAIGRLVRLKKLDLGRCNLQSLPESIGSLEQLEVLQLNGNPFSTDLTPAIGRLTRLKELDLHSCHITVLPDSFKNLDQLINLQLGNHHLREYPRCTLGLKNLRVLNISNQMFGTQSGITQLPVELAYTNLLQLQLEGNPITKPPKAIWTQGIRAIMAFMKEIIPGGSSIHVDTLSMIGDTGAGKTSLALSLVARTPITTGEADRTHVLQQFAMKVDENAAHSVNINDFGGHNIYHSVIPIFLPANGLVILVFNLKDEKRKERVRKWLMTAIAKSSEVRLIIVGTHADEVCELRSNIEIQLLEFLVNCLESALDEVGAHINKINPRSDGTHNKFTKLRQVRQNLQMALADFSQSAIGEVKAHINRITGGPDEARVKLEDLRQLLAKLQKIAEKNAICITGRKNAVRFVTLSCSVADEGLDKLRQLVVELMRAPETLPISWCQVSVEILKQRDDCLFITMKDVEDICRKIFTASDSSEALVYILRYLANTSQIIWLESHEELRDYVFHSPKKIIDACKSILYHDIEQLPNLQEYYQRELKEYKKGILLPPLLKELLSRLAEGSNLKKDENEPESSVVVKFMERFNLISRIRTESDREEYIVSCNLSSIECPKNLEKAQHNRAKCLNRVTVRLSFVGCLIPQSLFETSLSLILTVVGNLDGDRALTEVWRDGVFIFYRGVFFIAKRRDSVITLEAFSEPCNASPWTVLHPVLKSLSDYVHASWHGAPPHCEVICPSCERQTSLEVSTSPPGTIETDLKCLAKFYAQGEWKPSCDECLTTIPQSLCYPTVTDGSFTNDHENIEEFFMKVDQKHREASKNEPSSDRAKLPEIGIANTATSLRENLQKILLDFEEAILLEHVKSIAYFMHSKGHLNLTEWQTITRHTFDQDARNSLLKFVKAREDQTIRCLAEALRHIEKFALADALCPKEKTYQSDVLLPPQYLQDMQAPAFHTDQQLLLMNDHRHNEALDEECSDLC